MGQIDCKNCSIGTYVPEINYPGKSATDCRACPVYQTGTQSNKPAGYRTCGCLPNFFRLDRYVSQIQKSWRQSTFGSLTALNKWAITKLLFSPFKPPMLNRTVTFPFSALCYQHPIKCPFTDSCNGGIESSWTEGYEGTLYATCTWNHFLRFNRCLECPGMLVRVTSCVLVIVVFIFLFLLVFLGDSNAANGERVVFSGL